MLTFSPRDYFPESLHLPRLLYCRGELPPAGNKRLTIVGTRRPTNYGKACVKKLVGGLSGLPISIVSGLALGIDACAHEAALEHHLHTIAIPGSGLADNELYPRANVPLAKRILRDSGTLVSPWEAQRAANWTFPARNRIMAAIADLVLIIEASESSGTMITALAARELGIPLAAIPGPIDSLYSTGPNALIREGAHCITSASDIALLLGFSAAPTRALRGSDSPLLSALSSPLQRDDLLAILGLPADEFSAELTLLELSGSITIDESGTIRRIA